MNAPIQESSNQWAAAENIDKKEGEGMASKQEAMWMRERERAHM
jgi:hypothetical protein